MALDPKQVVKENKLLVICYVLALAPVGLYFGYFRGQLAGPDRRQANSAAGRILRRGEAESFSVAAAAVQRIKGNIDTLAQKVEKKELLTSKDITAFEERQTKLKERLSGLQKIYEKQDERLERWFKVEGAEFSDWPITRTPEFSGYVEYFARAYKDLIDGNKDLIGLREDGSPVLKAPKPANNDANLIVQSTKKYWFTTELLAAMKRAKVTKLASNIVITVTPPTDLAKDPLVPYRCQFTVEGPFRQVAVLVREILAAKLTFRLDSLEVNPRPFEYTKNESTGFTGTLKVNEFGPQVYFDREFYIASFPETVTEFAYAESTVIPEPDVAITLVVEGIDYQFPVEPKQP